jgi:uncharacterized delta-60 repeat protein
MAGGFLLGVGSASAAGGLDGLGACKTLERAVPLADGSVVAAGTQKASCVEDDSSIFLVKVSPDGAVDESFGDQGVADAPVPAGQSVGGLFLADGGKLILAGETEVDQFNPDGSLDNGFADGGRLDIGGDAKSVKVDDGSIYVLRKIGDDPAVAKYDPDGQPDASFGTDGVATAPPRPWHDPYSGYETFAIDSAGRVLIGGPVYPETGPNAVRSSIGVMRFDADGNPDAGFGPSPGGFVALSESECDDIGFCSAVLLTDLEVMADGTIVATGLESHTALHAPACYNGIVDTFSPDGGNGPRPAQLVGDCSVGRITSVLPDGDLIATQRQYFYPEFGYDQALFKAYRFHPRSSIDPDAGDYPVRPMWSGGFDLAPDPENANWAALDSASSQIVTVGDAAGSLVVARFDEATGQPVESFGHGGVVMLPDNSCPYGQLEGAVTPSPVWHTCRVAPPAGRVKARFLRRKTKRPALLVVASPGAPPADMWGSVQTLTLNLPRSLGPLRRIARLRATVIGQRADDTVRTTRKGRKVTVFFRAGGGGCDPYECSPPDPTVHFRVVVPSIPRKKLSRKQRRKPVRVNGRVTFTPDTAPGETWFGPNSTQVSAKTRR